MTQHESSPGRVLQGRGGGVVTYTATVTFTVHDHSDEHLQRVQAIKGEIKSWLESLDATVHAVTVEVK